MHLAARAFLLALAALGLLHMGFGEALTRMLPAPVDAPSGRDLWTRVYGGLLAMGACAMLVDRRWGVGAMGLTGVLLLPVVLLHFPNAFASGQLAGEWLGVIKWLAFAAGPVLVARSHMQGSAERAGGPPSRAPVAGRTMEAGVRFAPWLMAGFLVLSGVLHFRQTAFVVTLMPEWFPWRPFWVRFTAVTLMAGGIGLLLPGTRKVAGRLVALMIVGFLFLVHIPRMLEDPGSPVGWSEIAEAAAFSAIALMVAERGRRRDGEAG